MSGRKNVCNLFRTPKGCRFGRNCKYSHDIGADSGTSTPRLPDSSRSSPVPNNRNVQGQGDRAPRNICDFYWKTGQCQRGFECSFRHSQMPSATSNQDSQPDAKVDEDAPNSALNFFSAEGLEEMTGVARHGNHDMKPADAHNAVKRYLRDDYTFASPSDMQEFVNILASVNRRNKAWDSDSAQEFLDMIVHGNALQRIGEVLTFQRVSSNAGTGFTILSFQLGYFPILEYLTSDLVLKTTLHHNINKIYSVIYNNYQTIHNIIEKCLQQMIDAKSWKDSTPGLPESRQGLLTGVAVFKAVTTLMLQFFSRFKQAIRDYPVINELVNNIVAWFDIWSAGVSCIPPRFQDHVTSTSDSGRKLVIQQLREDVTRLQSIVSREHQATEKNRKPVTKPQVSYAEKHQALLARLNQSYDPPGSLRTDGRRHDNDFANIADIRIAPTHAELMCSVPPYLPFMLSDAPHHLPPDSIERHLDIQFRLLREDLTSSIREALTVIQDDLDDAWRQTQAKRTPTQLEKLVKERGGLYRTLGMNSVMFNVYTNVAFSPLKANRTGFTIGLLLDPPPGAARESEARKREEYWKTSGSKRLTSGSLVALVLINGYTTKVYLATLASSNQEIIDSAKAFDDRIQVRATFFDAEVELRALKSERITVDKSNFALLIDNGIMFESVRPFLKTLNTIEPTTIPFSRYLSRNNGLETIRVLPPKYATAPSFAYNLECLAKPRHYIHPLRASDANSVVRARLQLKEHSNLDPSQCDSVVDVLTREVALIQGPPGTGKSFTGKEILRVLFANKIKPIVLIAFTNHALDHMLTSILDAKITNKLVRLGSRSTDERISEYSLHNLEKLANTASLKRSVGREFRAMKELEDQMKEVMESIQIPQLTWEAVKEHLEVRYQAHWDSLSQPPFWVDELASQTWESEEAEGSGPWTVEQKFKGKKNVVDEKIARTFYGVWKHGLDIQFIQPPQAPPVPVTPVNNKRRQKKKKEQVVPVANEAMIQKMMAEFQQRLHNFFEPLGFGTSIPAVPCQDRPIRELLDTPRVWSMSLEERSRLASFWEDEMRSIAYNSYVQEYELLREEYEAACTRFNDVKDETRRRLLSQTDLIGCTTTGAAKLISLLTNVSPRVLMVEEAGQVLEAHILASLVPSVQHLICIGDPQQLRPNLATYSLSMDSQSGQELFKFDRSLMERMADGGMSMSQINVQRRMRPSISHYIRKILYPELKDHQIVHEYRPVQGMEKDVFFFTHTNKENGGDDNSVSKVNTFEVEMIRDLVVYFLKQEEYSSPGDIAVLCAYLGQLQQVRAALKSLKVAVAVDERDEEQLVKQGIEENTAFEEVAVAKHIRLGTVDIFQGEEAKIVIVSLVRNSGTFDTASSSIGFLKSSNRINVALSRAKHGLYIMGNASNLRKNTTWATIIDEMEERGQIGYGFPIVCPRHPDQKQVINKPGQLPTQSPGGGCLLPCSFRLRCGHNCTSSCHEDRDNHRTTRCDRPCPRLSCPRQHPCRRRCWEDCGKCAHPIYDVLLPCGHKAKSVPCSQMEDLRSVKCNQNVVKRLPSCEHSATMPCHRDPSGSTCVAMCDGQMSCCSKKCKSRCSDCQELNTSTSQRGGIRIRSQHKDHPCERPLYCQHLCGLPCSKDHECATSCKEACRQRCAHHQCPKPCSASCSPCMEPCQWRCAHVACPVLCGSICSRLPCDEICSHNLKCGHPCPSVCGEPCAKQKCIVCLPAHKKTDIVDLILQRRLSEIDLTVNDISERLITLDCGHIFTVETMDGHCGIGEYYNVDPMGRCTSPRAPPIKYQSPPTCPTCRGPITAFRYGRITKRANLDILEQNVASNMSKSLEEFSPLLVTITANLAVWEASAKQMKYESDFRNAQEFGDLVLSRSGKFGQPDEPLPPHILNQNAMKSIHGLSGQEGQAWGLIVKDLLEMYKKVVGIATTRSAHVRAYEAALTTLYNLEMADIAGDPMRATDYPEPVAIEAVNRKLGQPPHKADRRYHVEAFLLSVELRLMLAQVARARVDSLPITSNDPQVLHHRLLWSSFVEFIFDSCITDCKKTIAIADSSSASRQAARAAVTNIRSEFEKFRFEIINRRQHLFKISRLNMNRKLLSADIVAHKRGAMDYLEKIAKSYVSSRSNRDPKVLKEESAWFHENCTDRAMRVFKEYDALNKHVTTDGMYQPMTLQEREDIVKAFGFTHRGHFYNCENGHTFVITECGGAMENSRCPECGAAIGGSHHNLNSSNTRATEFEEIAGRQGAQTSPWRWAREA